MVPEIDPGRKGDASRYAPGLQPGALDAVSINTEASSTYCKGPRDVDEAEKLLGNVQLQGTYRNHCERGFVIANGNVLIAETRDGAETIFDSELETIIGNELMQLGKNVSDVNLIHIPENVYRHTVAMLLHEELRNLTISEDDDPQITSLKVLEVTSRQRAGDIHILPVGEQYAIQLRVDGKIKTIKSLSKEKGDLLVRQYINNTNVHGDAIGLRKDFQEDIFSPTEEWLGDVYSHLSRYKYRLSVGESASGLPSLSMRVTEPMSPHLSPKIIGFNMEEETILGKAAQSPGGLMLVTGPTGSGKTTTLYAILNQLRDGDKRIVTVEDPVESIIPGLDQFSLAGREWEHVLSKLMRRDPDIMLIGEIRDAAGASMAMHAANTGHSVLGTMHTNGAIEALSRLVDMGIPEYNVADQVKTVLCQRLVRKLDEKDRVEVSVGKSLLNPESPAFRSYEGTLHGRLPLIELFSMTDSSRSLIRKRTKSTDIEAQAGRKGNLKPMAIDGIRKVIQGRTTLNEVLGVVDKEQFTRHKKRINGLLASS